MRRRCGFTVLTETRRDEVSTWFQILDRSMTLYKIGRQVMSSKAAINRSMSRNGCVQVNETKEISIVLCILYIFAIPTF
jgi:hypothetical protein